ncbi:hypothetical protein ACOSP7_021188 [Xanthoceras sorbifolium]
MATVIARDSHHRWSHPAMHPSQAMAIAIARTTVAGSLEIQLLPSLAMARRRPSLEMAIASLMMGSVMAISGPISSGGSSDGRHR